MDVEIINLFVRWSGQTNLGLSTALLVTQQNPMWEIFFADFKSVTSKGIWFAQITHFPINSSYLQYAILVYLSKTSFAYCP